ncbi:hypothetical protein IYQ92_03210 [Streptococcus sp. HF-1907]|uniref:hypothetical protein n=1 Tax=Streptococcus sp. HF-1907 TaxID=2785793 RepID=UPI0018A0EFF5|nr:hypothetical protein [Streptococcus sp. HF-1907]MBF7094275.1 hypothetical protein [Streptococcus sp. HF-1907]
MTKGTKNTVSAETIVENLKEFTMELHQAAKSEMVKGLIEGDADTFELANFAHNISHSLVDLLKGKTSDEALENIFSDEDESEDEDATFVGNIAVNVKSGDIEGIEDIKDPKLKAQLSLIMQKLADELGGK